MSANCINKSSKEFKFLAEKFNVSTDSLAEIIYKYYEEKKSEEEFPSDIYIQAQLGQTQYADLNHVAKIVWDKWYADPQPFSENVKERALTFFPAKAVVIYKDSNNKLVLAVKEPVVEYEPKHRSDFKSWKEYNDYLLAMGEMVPQDQRDKEEQSIGKQAFTFKDGTKVTVPFKPNEQQTEALNAMNAFIKSDETTMTLSGYAGTGKTSLMEIIAAKAKKEGKDIVFSASTNKAAAILRDRVKKQGFTAQTLNKVFGIQVTPDESKPYDADNLVTVLRKAGIKPGTVVVIDEASMINEKNYNLLNNIAKENHLKIIYVGDKGQLAPVGDSQISKVFRNNNGRVINLTKVERTGDNAILKEATDVRNGQSLSMESSFNSRGQGVAYVKKSNKGQLRQIVEKFVPFLRQDPDYFRILAYTNAAVTRYNEAVRNTLGYTDNTPKVGEPIVGYNNWGRHYDKKTKTTTYDFVNSESYKVIKVKQPVILRKMVGNGTTVQLQALPITLVDAMGNEQTINFIDVKDNPQNRQAAIELAKEKARLFNAARQVRGKAKAELVADAYNLENFLFVNDDIKDGGKTLQKKYFDFGYAMTVHKSQGSTFKHVLIDDADIANARNTPNGWEGIIIGGNIGTSQERDFGASDMTITEQGNLFDIMNQSTPTAETKAATTSSSTNDYINMRQQLEYVAVSRATNTVTVIANDANVKKEDSPLNHLPKNLVNNNQVAAIQGENTIKQENNRSNNNQIKYSNEFRRIQETVRGNSSQGQGVSSVSKRDIGQDARLRLAGVLRHELESQHSTLLNRPRVNLTGKGNQFAIYKEVDPQLFHDIFEVARYYTPKGELVDLHDDYSNCKCYLSEDGTCGFAIEPDGNLVSVFSLGTTRGFLWAIQQFAIEEGATHLDAFASNQQNLRAIYEKVFGAKVAASMDYNMEFDHDNIAVNHGNPEVVFMVMGKAAKGEVTEKHFTKDQYDEAVKYQKSFIPNPNAPLPVEAPESPQKVSLRGYEYFNDLYEDTEVDAAWKIPILQDLDSQLATDNPDNNKILEQMDRILQSPSEEDYYKAPTAERQEVNEKMTDYERRNTQINALMDNNVGLLASEVKEAAEDIVNFVSDIITEIQNNPETISQYFPTIKPKADLSKATRKEIISTIGINNFIVEAKKRFENLRYNEGNQEVYDLYDNMQLLDQADLILNNWETMIELAADAFIVNEGVSIKRNTAKQTFETEEKEFTGYDYDNYVDPQDEDALREEKDEQEHWQVVVRTIDAFNSMSDLVKLAIHECYELDKDGNKILGKFGIPKRVNKVTAVNNILRWTNGTLDINEMAQKMEEKASRKPWVIQLTKRLRDTSGKEADFQSQFYGVMHRHFQLYGIGQLENGTYASKTLNKHKTLSDVIKGIGAQFQLKNHPLFTSTGKIQTENLNLLNSWYKPLYEMVREHGISFSPGYGYTSRKPLSEKDIEIAAKNLTATSRMLGYPVSEETMAGILTEKSLHTMCNNLRYIINTLEKAKNKPTENYDPFDYSANNNIRREVMGFLTPIVEELEEDASNAFFDNGNMYQSYVIPSFLTQLFDQFHQPWEQFSQWVDQFYGQSEWFKGKDGNWKLKWLKMMNSGNPTVKEKFDHKVQLNFNKHDYMRNMTPEELTLSVIMEYFSERIDMRNVNETPAWFRVPIQSNKPSSEFIRFFADRSSSYKDNIVNDMYDMFLQELSRIDTVRKRNKTNESDAIKSFDEQGRKFQFLPWFNSFLMDNGKLVGSEQDLLFHTDGTPDSQKASELKYLLNKKVDAKIKLSDTEEARLRALVKEATKNFMQMRADSILDNWKQSGILKAAEKIQGIRSLDNTVRDNLENFLWNDFFAANQILQLTIVDKAFYPNATELQKRLAELHAPGTRGNKFATDYKGRRVSDGNYRTLLIKDYDGFTANIIENISIVFDKKIAAAPESEKAGLKALKESLVGEKGAYRRINVTDGQAYSSPSSYRKKAFMFGKWSHKAEEIYQRLLKGDFSLSDLEVAFQPLKPFVYGHLSKQIGSEGVTPITNIPVPFQAKNSEYLLVMADALLRGQETGRPNLLKAIFDIMEQSHYDEGHYGEEDYYRTTGIDTVQFKSAIKSGAQGVIDIEQFAEMPGGEAGAYTLMKNLIYQETMTEDGTFYNYDSFIHKTDYDNYAIQQEVPAHFREHQQAEGSQQRMNIPTDLDLFDYNGEVNVYSWKDPDGTKHKMNAKEFRKEYERVHAVNIEDSFNVLIKELHLNSEDKKARNLALSEILQNEILSSPRYGIDLFQACQIDPATGEFRIPKGDPVQSKRIEQLINSIIKNRVNKQKISGGPIVQVTNFGTSRQLHIRFNDKNGNLLMTKEEYETKAPSTSSEGYLQYLKENQAGIAHFEIFAPIGVKKLFDKFKNPDGSINLEAVEKCDPELLKIITGRIPNEDKYSIAHGKIVGFMPALAGDAIMFPYELTEIDDSDFDVDKRYTMQKVINIVEDRGKIEERLFQRAADSYKKTHNGEISYEIKKKLNDTINMLLDNPERMKTVDKLSESLYNEYQRILREEYPYKTIYPKKGTRDANNNQIIDMSWAVMSNEMTADKVLNPGGFEVPKHQAYVIAAYRNSNGTISWEKLEGMTTEELQKLSASEKDLAWFDTHIQFYKQNAAGSNLIGVFAVNKVAHATLEGDGIFMDIEDFCGDNPFTICDIEFKGKKPLDSTKDSNGQLIGKNIGSGVGASADTAKDPWLDMININMTTAGMFNALMRLGMPMADAELFMAQDVILRLLNEFNRKSLDGEKTSLDRIIQEKLEDIKKKNHYSEDSEINTQPLTRGELKKGLIPVSGRMSDEREAIEYKTLLAFSKVKILAKAIRKPTLVTRLNSITSAVGPLIIDNIILEHKLQQFLQVNTEDKTGFYTKNPDGSFSSVDMDDILFDHPILKQFSRPIDSRNPDCPTQLMFGDMPAGSNTFKGILKALPQHIAERIYDDRQLLSKLSDFFQSYLLVANNVIKAEQLNNYIQHFPEVFTGKGKDVKGNPHKSIKEQYPDNVFIQAIQLKYDKKHDRAFLDLNTTGMKEQEKERLRMAWTDLHKANPNLSTQLFTYAFFRGGIGFSPKTWMELIPTYVKEHIKGYVDTYRHFPKINPEVVIDQFVRNNWDNSTLVPSKGGEGANYEVDLEKGTLIARSDKDRKDLKGIKYMKTAYDGKTQLWRLLDGEEENKTSRFYIRVDPLGNNGEFMEMSATANKEAIMKTTQLEDSTDTQELPAVSPNESESTDVETPSTLPVSDSQQSQNVAEFVRAISMQNKINTQEAERLFGTFKERAQKSNVTKGFKMYLSNVYKQLGIKLDPDLALKKFKEFC